VVEQRGGILEDGAARFTIVHATEVADLLDAASRAGHELADISLRKPNSSPCSEIDGKGVARLIRAIVRTAFIGLRRDRGALALSFILPIAFFTIFAVIFGGRRDTTPR